MKGAHADLSSAAWQEIGVKPRFGLEWEKASPDLQLFPPLANSTWKHRPTLCHPERSRGTCSAPSHLTTAKSTPTQASTPPNNPAGISCSLESIAFQGSFRSRSSHSPNSAIRNLGPLDPLSSLHSKGRAAAIPSRARLEYGATAVASLSFRR